MKRVPGVLPVDGDAIREASFEREAITLEGGVSSATVARLKPFFTAFYAHTLENACCSGRRYCSVGWSLKEAYNQAVDREERIAKKA